MVALPPNDQRIVARELIRSLRGHRSQTAFSRWLGYRTNVLYSWESGRRFPTAAEALRAAQRTGVDLRAAYEQFYTAPPPWLTAVDPTSPAGVAHLLRDLKGETPIVVLAQRSGLNRYSLARWLQGSLEPRLPQFLALVDAASMRLLDYLACLVDPRSLPSLAESWIRLEARRDLALSMPWTQAVLRALELEAYRAAPEALQPGWIGARLGIGQDEEDRCLTALARVGQIELRAGRWVPVEVGAVTTRRNEQSARAIKGFWADVGAERLRRGAPGLYSYNVFAVAQADLSRIEEMHKAYLRAVRSVIAASEPSERVVLLNQHLVALDGGG